jgi:hypothetical protein
MALNPALTGAMKAVTRFVVVVSIILFVAVAGGAGAAVKARLHD